MLRRRTITPLIFRFSEPTPFQLIRNALPVVTSVVPKHLYEGTDIAKNPANQKLVGTGPFKFGEYKPGEYYLLKRNDAYWQKDEPLLDEIVYQVLPDRAGCRQCARSRRNPACGILRSAARRSRPYLQSARA